MEYYENFIKLFTKPEESFKKFLKDGLKRSFQVSITVLTAVTLLQYLLGWFYGDFVGISFYEFTALMPFLLLLTTIISVTVTIITACLSSLLAQVFFKGKNEWIKIITLFNYVSIIPYLAAIPMQLFSYLPFPYITVTLFYIITFFLTVRAAGESLSKTCKTSFWQGAVIYFSVNLLVSIPVTWIFQFLVI